MPRCRPAVMQSQIYCGGCRNLLLYQRGALSVRCSICSTISAVVPAVERAQLVCVGCRTLLMYPPGARSVRCSCCHTITDARAAAFAQVNCSHCYTTLTYPSGALSVKCAVCQHVTNVWANTSSVSIPVYRPNGVMPPTSIPSTSAAGSVSHNETVVVENPMTMDESGKLVSNVVVGVTTGKK